MERITIRDRLRPLWTDLKRQGPRPLALFLAMLWAVVLFFGFAWSRCFFSTCPDVGKLAAFQPGGAPLLLDRNGEAFADLAPAERLTAPLSSLPSQVAQAFLAVEDKRFYEHRGVDWTRMGGAILADLHSGDFTQGFSTLTMQLARNVFPERIPGEEQTTRRKLLEIRVAQEIEGRYSKEEILELYLNHIYFGNRARGIAAAARQYFGVQAKDLTLPQAALLAALPKAPTHYDPRRHPEKALERRNLVLSLMEEQGRIPRRMAEQAKTAPLGLAPPPRQAQVESGLAPWFVEQVRHEMEERFGANLYTRPLRIVTTLDSAYQRAAEEELRGQLKRIESGELGAFSGKRYSPGAEAAEGGTNYLQGAAVMLDARDGDVLAWVGGRDYAQSQFDRVVQARRQPGSAFKPFVYAAALTQGWVLSQPLVDQPLRVRMSNDQVWQPHNFSDRYEEQISLRDALVRSKNVATVRLADAVGLREVATLAKKAGIDEPIPAVPAMALGTVAVSPLELTAAYTTFAGLGERAEPRLILRVEDDNGKVLWRSEPRRHPVLDPAAAYLVTNVLEDALVRGTGNLVQQTGLHAPAAGKTGTTNEGADAWFVGYTPEIVAGVWMGFDQPHPILADATGGRLVAPAWGRMLARVYQKRSQPKPWSLPKGVVSRPVDPPTGLIVAADCNSVNAPASELFLAGKEPAAFCPGRDAPPSFGFPSQRMLAEREKGQEDARKAERIARANIQRQQREQEQQRLRRQQEAERIAQKTQAERQAALQTRKDQVAWREVTRTAQILEPERRARPVPPQIRDQDEEAPDEVEPPRASRRGPPDESEERDVEPPEDDLSGWWELTNTIESTNYEQYRGLRLGYRLQLEQDGDRIIGRGQKWTEDGRPVSPGARSPIGVTGRIEGGRVVLRFTERGARRSTGGTFSWQLSPNRAALRGMFSSDAANASGSSVARRMD